MKKARLTFSDYSLSIFTCLTLVSLGLYCFFPKLRPNDLFRFSLQAMAICLAIWLGIEYVGRRRRYSGPQHLKREEPLTIEDHQLSRDGRIVIITTLVCAAFLFAFVSSLLLLFS